MIQEKNVTAFNADVAMNQGYLYSNTEKLSCNLANQRISQAIHHLLGDISGKKIIDVGCGDGTYTLEFLKLQPAYIHGFDASEAAIALAKQKAVGFNNIHFSQMDIYTLVTVERYDVAIVRGLLHHLYEVEKAISVLSKVAKEIIVIEPNGYNPILKIIEKTSHYHIEHEEKSYLPSSLDKWFRVNGCRISQSTYIGLVPMFCPDTMAKICKFFEPFIERIPLLCHIACGQYAMKIITP